MKLNYASTERLSAFIKQLGDSQLERIYWSFARLWLDTGDGELRLTFGPPHDRSVHTEMVDAPAAGAWVWAGLGDRADEHPEDEDGYPADDWPELVEWTRKYLNSVVGHIADDLEVAAEHAKERS